MMMWRLAFFVLCLPGLASAETFTWGCNTEPDMKEYRGERSADAGASWGVLFTKPHVPGCTQLSYQSTTYVKPGDKLGRLFACDKSGNCSVPSTSAPYKITAPPIGNPGGQEEAPIPPSPYKPAPTPTPPVARPSKLAGIQVDNIGPTSALVTFPLPTATGANIRLSLAPIAWGRATSVTCTGPDDLGLAICLLENLLPDRRYDLQGVYYFGVMNQGAIYGELSDVVSFITAPVVPTPPPAPTPVPPAPPMPPPALGLKDALQNGLDTCLTRKLAHTACMKALNEALRKVTP